MSLKRVGALAPQRRRKKRRETNQSCFKFGGKGNNSQTEMQNLHLKVRGNTKETRAGRGTSWKRLKTGRDRNGETYAF